MPAKQDIPALTGLRGAAALWVAAYHLLLPAGFVTGAAATLLGRGYLAVDLFFVLSGFVMALTYGRQFRQAPAASGIAAFLLRRLARLYPLYGVIIASRFLYTAIRYGSFDLPRPWIAAPMPNPALDIPANLLMVQSWGLSPSSLGTAWSISTEWGAYFLFPLLAILVLWRSRRTAAVTLATAAATILCVAAASFVAGAPGGLLDVWDGQTPGPMLRCLAGFTLGMGIWRLSQVPRIAAIAGLAAVRAAVLAALALALAMGAPDLAIYPLFPALVLCLACARQPSLAAARPLVWLGEISYALYLLHIFLLHPLDVTRAAARTAMPPALADAATPALLFAILLAASHLAYHRIEKPGRALIMRAGARLLQPARAAAVPVGADVQRAAARAR